MVNPAIREEPSPPPRGLHLLDRLFAGGCTAVFVGLLAVVLRAVWMAVH